ncbi:hypothetical protein DYB37_012018 [Aphanomyces astaci]|uniref:Uncharacterized protein n=1 Tax=Aphanomyces astaci TaxID=112090 RepID=A0A397C9A0_APHAT|nr:hypothetical protein DYB30_004639 [Aphanomyces astaci]RHZ34056.1 hypothetical protein DYB37_012018 [Aphanomyces astaci]RLO13063.1 hypothetical protein DYB28_008156 [Aphanomyces astaci]
MTTPVHLLPRGLSWGEDLQIYKVQYVIRPHSGELELHGTIYKSVLIETLNTLLQASKTVIPWRPEQQQPVRHITRYEKSREEREYDLVRAQYRDVQRVGESATKDKEIKDQMQALVDAKVKQSRYVQKFNLINHHSAEVEPVESALRPPNTRAPYNIVNHRQLDVPPVHVAPPDSLGKKMVDSQHLGRPFSVISNKYHTNHESRSAADAVRLQDMARTKFNKTHDFNPLLVRYYDETKETAFVAARTVQNQMHGVDRDEKLPHGEQFSAGKLYNIVNHKILRPDKYEAVTNVGNRRLNCMKSTVQDLQIGGVGVSGVGGGPNQTTVEGAVLPALVPPHQFGGMAPIQPEILFISHDQPVDPGGTKVAASPMTKPH